MHSILLSFFLICLVGLYNHKMRRTDLARHGVLFFLLVQVVAWKLAVTLARGMNTVELEFVFQTVALSKVAIITSKESEDIAQVKWILMD